VQRLVEHEKFKNAATAFVPEAAIEENVWSKPDSRFTTTKTEAIWWYRW